MKNIVVGPLALVLVVTGFALGGGGRAGSVAAAADVPDARPVRVRRARRRAAIEKSATAQASQEAARGDQHSEVLRRLLPVRIKTGRGRADTVAHEEVS